MLTLSTFLLAIIAQKYAGLGNWIWWVFALALAANVIGAILKRGDFLLHLQNAEDNELIARGFPNKAAYPSEHANCPANCVGHPSDI